MLEPGTHRYQVRALAGLARYVPIFIGLLLVTPFTTSVLNDSPSIAKPAWDTGSELLGLYGSLGVVVLPFVFLVTAHLRRGWRRQVTSVSIRGEDLVVEFPAARSRAKLRQRSAIVPIDRVRSGYAHPLDGDRMRLSIELEGGLTDGDRVVVILDRAEAEPLVKQLVGSAPRYELARSSFGVGLVFAALSIAVGAAVSGYMAEQLSAATQRLPIDPLFAAHLAAWRLGLWVVSAGTVSALLNLAVAPKSIMLGVDGLRIEGAMGRSFIAYESIEGIRAGGSYLVVRHRRRRRVRRTLVPAVGVDARLLATLASEVVRRCGASAAAASLRTLPTPEPGGLGAWREAILRHLDATGYRHAALSNDDLADAVSAPGLSKQHRIAAALALASRGAALDKTRIRIAAAAIADDATRAILERVAEEDEDDPAVAALLRRHHSL